MSLSGTVLTGLGQETVAVGTGRQGALKRRPDALGELGQPLGEDATVAYQPFAAFAQLEVEWEFPDPPCQPVSG